MGVRLIYPCVLYAVKYVKCRCLHALYISERVTIFFMLGTTICEIVMSIILNANHANQVSFPATDISNCYLVTDYLNR